MNVYDDSNFHFFDELISLDNFDESDSSSSICQNISSSNDIGGISSEYFSWNQELVSQDFVPPTNNVGPLQLSLSENTNRHMKRKLSVDTPENRTKYSVDRPIINENPLSGSLPYLLTSAFNSGDRPQWKQLISNYFHNSCLLQVSKPSGNKLGSGSQTIQDLFDDIFTFSPDLIMILKKTKRIPTRSGHVLICKIRMDATLLNTPISRANDCDNELKNNEGMQSVIPLIDQSKTKKCDVEAIRAMELSIERDKKLKQVSLMAMWGLSVNNVSNKVEMYSMYLRLVSLRAFEA